MNFSRVNMRISCVLTTPGTHLILVTTSGGKLNYYPYFGDEVRKWNYQGVKWLAPQQGEIGANSSPDYLPLGLMPNSPVITSAWYVQVFNKCLLNKCMNNLREAALTQHRCISGTQVTSYFPHSRPVPSILSGLFLPCFFWVTSLLLWTELCLSQ